MNILRIRHLRRRTIATLTLLAMPVAPLCASLCGSRACASLASARSDDCHSSLAADDQGPRTGVAAIRACGSRDFPAAALNEPTISLDNAKKDSTLHASSNFAPSQYVRLRVTGRFFSRADNECCIADISVQSTVLRI
jgi:hypothetical protein